RPGSDVHDPVLVHQALAESPGLERAATFGPQVGGSPVLYKGRVRTLVNGGWQSSWPAIEVFRIPGAGRSRSGGAPMVVAGGPEDLVDLSDLGVLGEGAAVLGPDVAADPSLRPGTTGWVLTDGLRRRERFFARLHDGASAATTPGDVRRTLSPARDLLEPGQDAWSTTVRLVGARRVSASSSASDANATGGSQRGELPYAALDGSDGTSWVSGVTKDGPTWWEVGLDESVDPGQVTIVGGTGADDNQRLRVRTARGVTPEQTVGPGERVVVALPDGSPRYIRVESSGGGGRPISLAEVGWPGRDVRRQLVLPSPPRSWGDPAAVVLRADTDARRGCAQVDGQVRCVAGRERADEEPLGLDRRFSLADASVYQARLEVRPRSGPALAALVAAGRFVDVTTSSEGTPDPRSAAWAAIDGDSDTTWTADPGDFRPTVALSWLGRRTIRGLTIVTAREVAARRPTEVTLSWPGGRREVRLDARGRGTFPPVRTRRLTVQVREAEFATSLGFDAQQTQLPVGITELRLDGLPALPASPSSTTVDRGCGSGPTVQVDGIVHRTAVSASAAQLLSGTDLPARICPTAGSASAAEGARLQLAAGPHDVRVRGSEAFQALSLVLSDAVDPLTASSASTAPTRRDGPVRRTVRPTPGSSVVDLGQNYNPGWSATQSGKALAPVVLDGWRQGWLLRSDAPVAARFAPDSTYRWGLGVGLLALGALVGLLLLPWTRGRASAPALGPAVAPAAVTLPLAALASLLVAGWPGLVVLAIVAATIVVLRRRLDPVGVWVLASTCFVASVAYWVQPWADASGWAGSRAWPAYVTLAPLLASVVLAAGRLPRFLNRVKGASSHR
ncbi:MAG: aftD, partial [Marmoricola sp.]|nr:aftD [Marmoricola sp.]